MWITILIILILLLLHFPAYHRRDCTKFGLIIVNIFLYIISLTQHETIDEYVLLLLQAIMTICLHLHISKSTLPILQLADIGQSPSRIFFAFYFVPIICCCIMYWVCYFIIPKLCFPKHGLFRVLYYVSSY